MKTIYSIIQALLFIFLFLDAVTLFGSLFIYIENPTQPIAGLFAGSFMLLFGLMLLLQYVTEKRIKA